MTTQSLEEVFTKMGRILDQHEKRRETAIQKLISGFVKEIQVAARTAVPVVKQRKVREIQAAPIKPLKTRKVRTAAPAVAPKPAKKGRPAAADGATAAPRTRAPRATKDGGRLLDRMVAVMGVEIMGAADVVAALKKAGTAPQSEKLQNYISFMLSQNPEVFRNISRGKYQAISGKGDRVTSAKTSPAESGGPVVTSTERDLSDLGIDTKGAVASNPFPPA